MLDLSLGAESRKIIENPLGHCDACRSLGRQQQGNWNNPGGDDPSGRGFRVERCGPGSLRVPKCGSNARLTISPREAEACGLSHGSPTRAAPFTLSHLGGPVDDCYIAKV